LVLQSLVNPDETPQSPVKIRAFLWQL